jgi:hypothetical protein
MRTRIAGLFAVAVLSFAYSQAGENDERSPAAAKPDLVAIKFHADWCASCRRMGTLFEDLTTVSENQPVLFTRLDLTDRSSRTQARYLMTMLGLGDVWEQTGAGEKTGFIVLVDADTKQVVGQLSADQDLKQMKAALQETLSKTQS